MKFLEVRKELGLSYPLLASLIGFQSCPTNITLNSKQTKVRTEPIRGKFLSLQNLWTGDRNPSVPPQILTWEIDNFRS